jgi:hypothetical protein
LETYFKEHPPRSIAEAQAVIEKQTGLKRSPTQVRAFLKRLGFRCLKAGFVPGPPAPTPEKQAEKQAEQAAFQAEQLEPRLAEAQAGQRVVLFVDAAHFVHGAFLGTLWCLARVFLPSPAFQV